MKKFILIILSSILILTGCEVEYELTETGTAPESSVQTEVQWDIQKCLSYTLQIKQASLTPRGLVIPGPSSLKCYSPENDSVSEFCGDPLCSHDFMSDCPFSDFPLWMESPVSDGSHLYYIHRSMDPSIGEFSKYRIVCTDLYGMDMKTVYETSNALNKFYLTDEALYFDETGSEEGALIYRYDLKTKKITSPKINSDKGLIYNTAFLPVDGRICYIKDDALYRCNREFTESEKVRDDFIYRDLYTDGKYIYHSLTKEGIFRTDLTTGETVNVYRVSEGTSIYMTYISPLGIFFDLKYSDKIPNTKNFEEWKSAFPDNSVYLYPFSDDDSDGSVIKISMGTYYHTDFNGDGEHLYFQECVPGNNGRVGYGDWYITGLDISSGLGQIAGEKKIELRKH